MELPRAPAPDAMNQTPAFENIDLFGADRALVHAVKHAGVDAGAAGLLDAGRTLGAAHAFDLGRLANEHAPRLRLVDARGDRLEAVEFHPAWHELMARSMAAGMHSSTWDAQPEPSAHVARAARLYMTTQVEAGHVCPITMTHASLAVLRQAPDLIRRWAPLIASRRYDPAFRPWWEKQSVTIGMGMTERQGGTDVRANTTRATPHGAHYRIDGQKWFMSAPMCDAFLVLAQAPGGLSCFLVPRFTPDGDLNGLRFRRLKDKLGNRSNASSEVEFENAFAERIGEEGRGVRAIIPMVQLTRLDCAVSSAGLMRYALASALHHAGHRSVFQRKLIDQPAMRVTLADMALDSIAATALTMRLAGAFDAASRDPAQSLYARVMTPAIKYFVCKLAPGFIYEAMECHGGNGYVEELPLARLYREAPVNAIWEGSGNVMALDVLRAVERDGEAARSLLRDLAEAAGPGGRALAQSVAGALTAPDAQAHARRACDGLARLAAAAALAQSGSPFAQIYAQRRLASASPGPGASWGSGGPQPGDDDLIAYAS